MPGRTAISGDAVVMVIFGVGCPLCTRISVCELMVKRRFVLASGFKMTVGDDGVSVTMVTTVLCTVRSASSNVTSCRLED